MKRKGILIVSATMAMAASSVAMTIKNTSALEVNASSKQLTSGLFYKVTSATDIEVGDEIIFVSSSGYALDDCWNNPANLHGTQEGITITMDKSIAFLQSSPATTFTVESGNYDAQSLAFKGSMGIGGIYKENVYLAQNQKVYQDKSFGSIAYFFEDGFGIESSKTNEDSTQANKSNANWYLTEAGDGDGISIKHVYGGKLGFAPGLRSGAFIRNPNMWGHYSDVEVEDTYIYKKIDENGESTSYSITFLQDMDKTTYVNGDEIDLSGLELNLTIRQGSGVILDEDYAYVGNENLFSYPKYAIGNGPTTINVTFVGKAFTRDIYVDRENQSAGKLESSLRDYRGTFMLTLANDDHALKGENVSINFDKGLKTVSVSPVYQKPSRRVATDPSNDPYLRFEIVKNSHDDEYYSLKCTQNDQYLSYGRYAHLEPDDNSTYEEFYFEYSGTGVRIKSSGNGEYLYYDATDGFFKFGESKDDGQAVYLWKYGSTAEELAGLDDFVASFLDATDACDATGQTNRITEALWTGLETQFNALSTEAQGLLANIVYIPGEPQARSIDDAMNRYDYIVAKYLYYGDTGEVLYDFIQRRRAGVNPYPVGRIDYYDSYQSDNSSLLPIIIIASAWSVAVATLIVIKKGKEQ